MSRWIQTTFLFTSTIIAAIALTTGEALAARGGGGASISGSHAIGFGLSLVTAGQNDLNSVMDATATAYPGTFSTKNLGSAYEFFAQYSFRFSGTMFGIVLRPGYFTQSATGNCGTGSCDYKLTGLSLFPMLRLIPLENAFIKFYLQAGIGYGNLKAEVSEVSSSASFSGDAYGGMAGIGVDFCFTGTHCLTVEGNVRYLPVARNVASASNGTFASGGFSQVNKGQEVEYNGNDLSTTMSGLQGVLAYTLNF